MIAILLSGTASLDRALAAKRRDALLLYEYDRDAAGLPIAGTQRLFKLTANPRQIGQKSVGLGVYLTSIILYMAIMILLALLSLYLIVNNSQQAGYTDTYTLFVNGVSTSAPEHIFACMDTCRNPATRACRCCSGGSLTWLLYIACIVQSPPHVACSDQYGQVVCTRQQIYGAHGFPQQYAAQNIKGTLDMLKWSG